MLKSMTAYGRGSSFSKIGHVVIEIQSLNRKFLEVNIFLPRELSQFEVELKKWILSQVSRGQVNIKVNMTFEESIPYVLKPNLPLIRQFKDASTEIAKELHLNEEDCMLFLIDQIEGLFHFTENKEEEESYRDILKKAFKDALESFLKMKVQEGVALQADIQKRIEKMREELELIRQKVPDATIKLREKLIARLEEILPGKMENDERVMREVAIYAEKIDVAEEITRFSCHLIHLEELLQSTAPDPVGKTMEFILQELNREINTIGNKSSDLEIARSVIEIKSELERIREQIQNIE